MRAFRTNTIAVLLLAIILVVSSRTLAQLTAPASISDTVAALVRLRALGYWIDSQFSLKGIQTKQAIIAFQKISGLKRTGKLSDKTVEAILKADVPLAKDSMHARHLEVDLNRQVLFIVDSADRVQRILVVSTGNGKDFFYPDKGLRRANTPRGQFKVYFKRKGLHKSKLGLLLNPLYIVGGVAIHGSASVPAVPASHGCIRIPNFASDEMFRIVPIGMPVVVYGQNP